MKLLYDCSQLVTRLNPKVPYSLEPRVIGTTVVNELVSLDIPLLTCYLYS